MTQAHDPIFPQSASGSMYPKNYVVGVIDDLEEAQRAEQAFKAAGYSAEESRLLTSDEELQKSQELEENKNWLQRFLSSVNTSEFEARIYQVEAQKGHHILYIHANSQDEVDKINDLMQQYNTHTIKFFGTWTVTDIPSSH